MFKNKNVLYLHGMFLGIGSLKSQQKSKQSGRSMIEMLGVLAIVGILSAGGIAGYSMAMTNHKTNAYIEKVQLIAQRTRELYNGDYSEMTFDNQVQKLIEAGLITDAKNPFGGSFFVRRGANAADGGGVFVIYPEQSNVPVEACVKISMTDWGNSGMVYSLEFENSNPYLGFGANKLPLSAAKATSVCQQGAGRYRPKIGFK